MHEQQTTGGKDGGRGGGGQFPRVGPQASSPQCLHFSHLLSGYKEDTQTQMYGTDFWTLWEKARVGCSERTALKHVYYLG